MEGDITAAGSLLQLKHNKTYNRKERKEEMKQPEIFNGSGSKAGLITLIVAMVMLVLAPFCYAAQSPEGSNTTPEPQSASDVNGTIDNVNNGTEGEWILVTPYDKKERDGKTIEKKLIKGYRQLKNAETPADLITKGDIVAVAEEAAGHYIDPDNLVVRDLFNLTGSDDVEFPLKVKYELNLGDDEWVVLIHYLGDKDWEVLDNDRVVNNGDGTIEVTTDEYGLYAFVTEKVPTSDQKLNGFNWIWILIIVLIVIAGLIVFAVVRRRKNGRTEKIE